jgi:Domain of unknown function (DUF4136)
MNLKRTLICLLVSVLPLAAFAQKVRRGYDKGTDFGKFKSYTWAEPTMPVTRPLLYQSVVGAVDNELKSKGLTRVEHDGDLILIPQGGMEFGLNQAASTPIVSSYSVDPSMWTGGAAGPSNLMAPYVPKGTLVLAFVDRGANKVIWNGSVSENLDIENKNKSWERIQKAIVNLLKEFPPKTN